MPINKKPKPIPVEIRITRRGITVAPDPIPVPQGQHNVQIDWQIKTPGWQFTNEGIVIRRNYLQFRKRRRESARWFHWRSLNSHKGERTYEYTINLKNGKNRLSLDPGIKNGGR